MCNSYSNPDNLHTFYPQCVKAFGAVVISVSLILFLLSQDLAVNWTAWKSRLFNTYLIQTLCGQINSCII